ncbi:MAG: hypothetical protein RL685_1990 [Pseudomonadota bacterium]|jgi:uncharacterized protein (TIGR03118 family)
MSRTLVSRFRCGALLALALPLVGCERDTRYLNVVFERFDLTVDGSGAVDGTPLDGAALDGAALQDPNLVNPIGLQLSPGGSFWVANNATGTSTVYRADGTPLPASEPLLVTLPAPAPAVPSVPPEVAAAAAVTGVAYNGGYGLTITSGERSGSARYVFASADGTLLGFNPDVDPVNAVIAVDNSASGAVYRGLSVVPFRTGSRVYVTNFSAGTVDVFDPSFAPAGDLAPVAFEDLELPPSYAPFGIQRIDRRLYVSYAERDAEGREPVRGPGKGYVDAFALDGTFLARIASEGSLDAPWGMTRVPWYFPYFGGALLVGNLGDGRINAFDLYNRAHLGSLNDPLEQPLVIDGLGDLVFGAGPEPDYPGLFFTAGPNGGQGGTFGRLQVRFVKAQPPQE